MALLPCFPQQQTSARRGRRRNQTVSESLRQIVPKLPDNGRNGPFTFFFLKYQPIQSASSQHYLSLSLVCHSERPLRCILTATSILPLPVKCYWRPVRPCPGCDRRIHSSGLIPTAFPASPGVSDTS